jgi:hypothetical protein
MVHGSRCRSSLVRLAVIGVCVTVYFGGIDGARAQETGIELPLIELERGRAELTWERRARGRLTATVTLVGPTLRAVRHPDPTAGPPPRRPPDIDVVVRRAVPWPTEVDRLAIRDASIVFVDRTVPGGEVLRIHDLDVLVENFSTNRAASDGLPMLVTARGRIGRAGRIVLYATVNPWTPRLDFAGRAQITGLELADLRGFVEEQAGVAAAGTFTAFVELSVQEGRISGTVRPFLIGVEIAPGTDPGLADRVRAWFAQLAVDVLTDDAAGREAVATDVEIRGELTDPDVGLWSAFVGVLTNAFVEALSAGFADLPRPP